MTSGHPGWETAEFFYRESLALRAALEHERDLGKTLALGILRHASSYPHELALNATRLLQAHARGPR